jgi:hypothetical protein
MKTYFKSRLVKKVFRKEILFSPHAKLNRVSFALDF